jgi:hypothetical protein
MKEPVIVDALGILEASAPEAGSPPCRAEFGLGEGSTLLCSRHREPDGAVLHLRASCSNEFRLKFSYGRILESAHARMVLTCGKPPNEFLVLAPSVARLASFDSSGRIMTDALVELETIKGADAVEIVGPPSAHRSTASAGNSLVCLSLAALRNASPEETRLLDYLHPGGRPFQVSNWFLVDTWDDIWASLIAGYIYDKRRDDRIRKRFRCQQCAYAWWKYLDFCYEQSKNAVYLLLRNEVSAAVVAQTRLSFGHGFWSDAMETHSRFHFSGIHLLISQYLRTQEQIWLDAAEASMAYAAEHLTQHIGRQTVWFLHDTEEEYIQPHRFFSRQFGKQKTNSLTLNTHVYGLTCLARLTKLPLHGGRWDALYQSGLSSLRAVLAASPGNSVYRAIDWVSAATHPQACTKLPLAVARRIHAGAQSAYGIAKRWLPRLVMPDGFIERDLTLSVRSKKYHILNLKDLLLLYQLTNQDWLRPYIVAGLSSGKTADLARELKKSPYFLEWLDILQLAADAEIGDFSAELSIAQDIVSDVTRSFPLDFHVHDTIRF